MGVLTQTFEPASVCLVMECPLGIMMMNMSEIRFETSFITVIDYVIYYFSPTRDRIPVVYIFVPIIMLSVQHGNVYQWCVISCLSSRFQSNTEMYTTGIHFRASCVIWRSHVSRAISPKAVRDSRNPSFAQTCPNSAVSKAMVNPSIIYYVSFITI